MSGEGETMTCTGTACIASLVLKNAPRGVIGL